jgi:S-adenosylmethionine/arginine decarboxylase-like enzyme
MKAEIFNFRGWIAETLPETVIPVMEKYLDKAGFTVLNKVAHQFSPGGFTAVWVLAESHLAVHSFPEENKTYVEISSCSRSKNEAFIEQIQTLVIPE